MSEILPDYSTPALDFDGMLALARGLVGIDLARKAMEEKLRADAETDPTVLALRSARAALEFIFAEEVPPEQQARIAKILQAEREGVAGHG